MSKKRVLYAEDDWANRKLLETKLTQAGIECDTAEDGQIALQMYAENEYDLVVLDQYMPYLDGEDVAAEIRKSSADIPLIAITSDDSLKTHLLEKGFNEVIVKPLRGSGAITLIKSYISGPQAETVRAGTEHTAQPGQEPEE
jgi:CheY-like chemotaxis protein